RRSALARRSGGARTGRRPTSASRRARPSISWAATEPGAEGQDLRLMSVHKANPTSAGRRFVVQVKTPGLHKGEPYGPLLAKKNRTGARNNAGRITVRHQGGGHKQRYRLVDFKRDKDGVPARVERLEYDPNRSAH